MTGLEKMKNQILGEARATADAKIAEAQSQADEIISQAKEEAEKISAMAAQKLTADVAGYKERIASSIEFQKRTKLLTAKQGMIAEILDKAYASFEAMETEEYFQMLLKMLGKHVLPQNGEIYFSAADLSKMPSGFEAEVQKVAKANGGSLKVVKEGKKIENGFILAYGGIEENCTLRAMLDAKRDELSDQVNRLLFK